MLVWNLMLAATWAAISGSFSVPNLGLGFGLGYLVLFLAHGRSTTNGYFKRVPQALRFVAFFLWELLLSNLRVAHDVLTPRHHTRPGVIAIPLSARSDIEITVLANLITLTPGTLSLDLSPDRKTLYIHAMYIDDVEALRRRIKDGLERRALELLR